MTHQHHHEPSIESTAKADAKALQSAGDNVTQHGLAVDKLQKDAAAIRDHGGAAAEQRFWDAMRKNTADKHLPGLYLHDANGHVDSVVADHRNIYHAPSVSPGLQRGDGPYQAFKRQGMSDEAARDNANKVMKETGRKEFNHDEQFAINKDGSVTCHIEDKAHPGDFKEVTYSGGKVTTQMQHVADVKGYTETTTDAQGNWLATKFREEMSGSYEEKTERQDGSRTDRIGREGEYTEWQYDGNGDLTSTTKQYKDENNQDVVWVVPEDRNQPITKTTADGVYSYSNYGGANGFKDHIEWFNPADPSQPATMTTADGVYTYGKDENNKPATWFNPVDASHGPATKATADGVYTYGKDENNKPATWFNPVDSSHGPATKTTADGVYTYGKTWDDGTLVDATWYVPKHPSATDKPSLITTNGQVY